MIRSALRTLVETMVGRTDKTTAINYGLELGLAEIAKLRQWRDVRTETNAAISADDAYITLATDFSQLVEARLISVSSTNASAYSAGTTYTVGQCCSYGGSFWRCILESTGNTPVEGTYWTLDEGVNSYPFEIRPKIELVAEYPNVAALTTGRPCQGYIEGGTYHYLYLYPVSDASYTLRYTYKKLLTFTSDATENPLEGLDYALACWAAGFTFDTMEQFDKSAQWFAKAAGAVKLSIGEDSGDAVHIVHDGARSRGPRFTGFEYLDPFAKKGV